MRSLEKIVKIKRRFILFFINTFLCGTHFFNVKRNLLNIAGFNIGIGTKIVGPIKITGQLTVGKNSWIGTNFCIYGNGSVFIGNNCDVAPGAVFLTGTHEIGDSNRRAGRGKNEDIHIGDGCWICGASKFIAGVNIGDSTVVAAGSVVNKDLPDNVLAAGVPCVVKKQLV